MCCSSPPELVRSAHEHDRNAFRGISSHDGLLLCSPSLRREASTPDPSLILSQKRSLPVSFIGSSTPVWGDVIHEHLRRTPEHEACGEGDGGSQSWGT